MSVTGRHCVHRPRFSGVIRALCVQCSCAPCPCTWDASRGVRHVGCITWGVSRGLRHVSCVTPCLPSRRSIFNGVVKRRPRVINVKTASLAYVRLRPTHHATRVKAFSHWVTRARLLGLTSKIQLLRSMLNFDVDVKKTSSRHECENPLESSSKSAEQIQGPWGLERRGNGHVVHVFHVRARGL